MKRRNIFILILACITLAITASQIASSFPDGLEWVAEKVKFMSKASESRAVKAPFPDYELAGIRNGFISPALAAIVGTLIVFVIVYISSRLIVKKKQK